MHKTVNNPNPIRVVVSGKIGSNVVAAVGFSSDISTEEASIILGTADIADSQDVDATLVFNSEIGAKAKPIVTLAGGNKSLKYVDEFPRKTKLLRWCHHDTNSKIDTIVM
mmetsp:Transcript_9604/g.10664  ORF Transcript_9604/g.10664 Transcript_9604/m.10664 type:complete len:110 (+) Transcript_9604:376-705(+)